MDSEFSSAICIPVEFLAGTEVEDAILQAKLKAREWDVAYVTFNFNGTSFYVGRRADTKNALEEYKKVAGKGHICES